MRTLTILFTNVTLAGRSGTEVYIKEAVRELVARGHRPIVYSPNCGAMAAEIRALSVPVVSDIAAMREAPDVIHAHHAHQAVTALLAFPGTPAIFVVHDWVAWHDRPPALSGINRYVAVDSTVRDRLTIEAGIGPDRVELIGNWADTTRFHVRDPLPARPQRALVFSNYVHEGGVLPHIRAACDRAGITLDAAGERTSGSTAKPEELLPAYDLVFAKAKSALEALAAGCAVILCDENGLGRLVTSAELELLLRYNLGRRLLTRVVSTEAVGAEIARFDAADAARVSARVRAERGIESGIDALLGLYERVIGEGRRADQPHELVAWLQSWSGWTHPMQERLARAEYEQLALAQYAEHLHEHVGRLHAHMAGMQDHFARLSSLSAAMQKALESPGSATASPAAIQSGMPAPGRFREGIARLLRRSRALRAGFRPRR